MSRCATSSAASFIKSSNLFLRNGLYSRTRSRLRARGESTRRRHSLFGISRLALPPSEGVAQLLFPRVGDDAAGAKEALRSLAHFLPARGPRELLERLHVARL